MYVSHSKHHYQEVLNFQSGVFLFAVLSGRSSEFIILYRSNAGTSMAASSEIRENSTTKNHTNLNL
jgi:hypothetical protein